MAPVIRCLVALGLIASWALLAYLWGYALWAEPTLARTTLLTLEGLVGGWGALHLAHRAWRRYAPRPAIPVRRLPPPGRPIRWHSAVWDGTRLHPVPEPPSCSPS